ncbi:DNA (cytosine-5-)-methyltransferase [Mycoplasma sp. 1654_15]|uniref:DNA (cytosine-5-)-methyltransferase n=1 Tax=Mycoplasma sp. 1654_15 TaxID=2725994 RepID=UPI0014493CAD|nr:DNA (cytosine-5-)-methyltransferase [Mycoplasma sp. 1654_15]QJB71399.1 DNA (cytosine-5-)-methyltransferase [Mycoplasma sp. 1654_15]
MTKKDKKEIRVVELFAGVGGFRLGFERTSKLFKTVWANQWEPNKTKQWAFDCYTKHFGNSTNHVNDDIANVIDQVPEHDLLVGGFPCQDYSVARTKAEGIKGKKGVLWWSILKIIQKRHPNFILLENVDRLIKSPANQRGRDFGIMLKSLENEGYNVEWRIIDASDYGFVQRRKRVFIFAYKKELTQIINKQQIQENILIKDGFFASEFLVESQFKKSNKSRILKNYSNLVDVSNNFSFNFFNSGSMIDGNILTLDLVAKSTQKPSFLKDIIEKEEVDSKFFIYDNYQKFSYLKGAKKVQRTKPNGEQYTYSEGSMIFPDDLNKPARTMLTSEGSVNRSTHIIEVYMTKKLRTLTPLEIERINGFDDNWTNTGMPERFRYFCMGNALVVPVIEKIAKQILKIWDKAK